MKKYLFFSTLESTTWGGSEQLWSDMALSLLEKGAKVLTNTLEWPDTPAKLSAVKQAGGVLTFRPNVHRAVDINDSVKNKIAGYRWKTDILNFNPDVVFISQGGTFDNSLLQYGEWLQSLGKPVYILCQFTREYEYMQDSTRAFFSEFVKKAAEVWFVSKRNKDAAEIVLAQKLLNARVIKNPIKIRQTTKGFPATGTYNIGVVARLDTEIKGYDILMNVFGLPQWKDRNYQVNVYGTGPHKIYLEELVAFFGLQNRIIFKGHVEDIVALWEENHILLLTSRGEGTPLSLLEANYCKRAAVVTDVGGNAEVVREGYNGFVAEAPALTCVANAMERAWEQRHNWEQMGLAAKEHIDKLYPADAVEEAVSFLL